MRSVCLSAENLANFHAIRQLCAPSWYHDLVGGEYAPFEGICLTDTFQLYEKDDLISRVLVDNSARRTRQKKLDIRVIIGNPPYSVGQGSQNDNNQNVGYPSLDARIGETYAARSAATSAKALYDSYVRAIRWASDRVGESGVIGFVTNAGFVEAGTSDGLRKCLAEEFSSLYVFHLRGNQRTSGELSKREGGKVFGSGSRAPVAISLLVKDPKAKERGEIHFRDVGDCLTREEKLAAVASFGSIAGIAAAGGWTRITPDAHGDWLKQRDGGFDDHIAIGIKDKKEASPRIFASFSLGVTTARDAWAYNPSRADLGERMGRMVAFFNGEVARFNSAHPRLDKKARDERVADFVSNDPTKISWTRALKNELTKDASLEFDSKRIVPSLYRPFTKQWLYFDRRLNEYVYQLPRIFPCASRENRVIMVKQRWPGTDGVVTRPDRVWSAYPPREALRRSRQPAGDPESRFGDPDRPLGDPESRFGDPDSPPAIPRAGSAIPTARRRSREPVRRSRQPAGDPESRFGDPDSSPLDPETRFGDPDSPPGDPESAAMRSG
jgi:predicted helicase